MIEPDSNASIEYIGLVDDSELELDLDRAALDLALLDHPNQDVVWHRALLDRIGGRLRECTTDIADLSPQADLLREVIAGEFGFSGDRETYDDPANADFLRMLERRRGLPICLSILYVSLARRLGWVAHVLDSPGHALICLGTSGVVVIDPFNDGITVERPGGLDAGRFTPALGDLSPMTNQAVLIRLLLNQASRASKSGDFQRAGIVMRRITVLAPGYSPGWWERARLELAIGQIDTARSCLVTMLEMTKHPAMRKQIETALRSL